jgi:CheY-like chemotaxis protein
VNPHGTTNHLLPGARKATRILVVDDDPSVRAALRDLLDAEGYSVHEAEDGRAAIAAVGEKVPHLVLLDLNMPRKDGWATFERLMTIHPALPVIIVTARPQQGELARSQGAAGFMEKPLKPELLLHLIEKLLAEDAETRLLRSAVHFGPAGFTAGTKAVGS